MKYELQLYISYRTSHHAKIQTCDYSVALYYSDVISRSNNYETKLV